MKFSKVTSLCAVALITVGAAAPAFAGDTGDTYDSNGQVQFIPNTDPTKPVDPTDPDPTNPVDPIDPTDPTGPKPGTDGPLSIDYASSFDFGVNKIANIDKTYYAAAQKYTDEGKNPGATVNYVQITDNRGTNKGWSLSVKQNGQLKSTVATTNDTLTASEISIATGTPDSISKSGKAVNRLNNSKLDPNGAETPVMDAANGAGAGTWVNRFGEKDGVATVKDDKGVDRLVNKEVSLFVPGDTVKDAQKYKTTLTWVLTDKPGQAAPAADQTNK